MIGLTSHRELDQAACEIKGGIWTYIKPKYEDPALTRNKKKSNSSRKGKKVTKSKQAASGKSPSKRKKSTRT
jgi:hypothetical protein